MLNIVIPMAGRGSRFASAGYDVPKPLIPVAGVPMIELVVDNIAPARPHRFIFLVLQEHLETRRVAELIHDIAPGSVIVPVREVTQGAACTVLLAREHVDTSEPLMIANSDQWVVTDIDEYLRAGDAPGTDGLIMTMVAQDKKWSYVGYDERGYVSTVVEKQVISDQATVGIYNFTRGSDFVAAADEMIASDLRVNGEFYVAPVYNQIIEKKARVATFSVGDVEGGMWGLGTPEDLELFLASPVAARATERARTRRASLA